MNSCINRYINKIDFIKDSKNPDVSVYLGIK